MGPYLFALLSSYLLLSLHEVWSSIGWTGQYAWRWVWWASSSTRPPWSSSPGRGCRGYFICSCSFSGKERNETVACEKCSTHYAKGLVLRECFLIWEKWLFQKPHFCSTFTSIVVNRRMYPIPIYEDKGLALHVYVDEPPPYARICQIRQWYEWSTHGHVTNRQVVFHSIPQGD